MTGLPDPYWTDGRVTIYHADCADILPHLAGQVDVVVTSPPYNLGCPVPGFGHYDYESASLKGRGGAHSWNRLEDGYTDSGDDGSDDAMPHADYVAWQQQIISALWDTLTDSGAIYYNHKPRIGGAEARMPFELIPDHVLWRQMIVWDRGSGFCRTGAHFVPAYELIMLLAREGFRLNTRSVDDVWRIPFDAKNPHPAPFPLGVPLRAIGSCDGQTVLDPFCGSGTTLRAALDLGRERIIGVERSEQFCRMAVERLSQGSLFSVA